MEFGSKGGGPRVALIGPDQSAVYVCVCVGGGVGLCVWGGGRGRKSKEEGCGAHSCNET